MHKTTTNFDEGVDPNRGVSVTAQQSHFSEL